MSNNWNDPNAPQGGDQAGGDQSWNQSGSADQGWNEQGSQPSADQSWDQSQGSANQAWDAGQQQAGGWDANAGQQAGGWDAGQQQAGGWDANAGQQAGGWDANAGQQAGGWDPNAGQQGYAAAGAAPGYGAPYGAPPAASGNLGPLGMPLAPWPKRALGALVDIVVPSIIISLILGAITGGLNADSNSAALTGNWWSGIVSWALIGLLLAFLGQKTGQTPGRKIAKTQLVNEQGQVPTFVQIFLRTLLHIVDSWLCCIGFLWPLWDSKRQTFADKIMKTYVINVEQSGPINVQQ